MAESSNPGGLGKQLFGAKNETIRGSKRKSKRGKKPAKTQSKESLESELKGQECSSVISVKPETVDNNEVSKMNMEQKSQTLEANDEKETANISEEANSRDNEKMATSDTTQADEINEEFMNKDGQRELEITQEQRSQEQGSKPELAKPDQASYNKKRKLSLRSSKKVKLSKSQSSVEQDERGDILTSEAGAVDTKTADENAKESCEKEVNQAGTAKFDEGDGLPNNENNDASKSPEGIQEKSSKNNKGKKLKQLASFGRAKKKPEIAVKLETFNETCESLGDGSVRSEGSASTRSQDSQNTEIVDSVLEETVAVDKNGSNNEHVNDERDGGTEIEKKEVAKEKKKKGSVLGFKRISKSNLGKRKSSKNEEQGAESSPREKTSARKENDDVSITERVKNEDEFEENKLEYKVEPKASETETADLKPEKTSGTEAEMTREASNKEEENSAENKGTGVTKKEKKESILRRSLRKFKSPPKALQGNRKSYEDEKSAVTEVGESVGDVQRKDELSEKAVCEETPDQIASEESSALKEMEKVKELEYLTEVKEKSVDELNFHVNKELSTQNNIEEQKESKQSKVEEEISRETLARDDTQTEEEITKEAQEICHKLMKTVIHELTEFIEKKEEERAAANATQVEKREDSVKFSHDENAPVESLQQTNAIDEADMEREAEDESYDSDVTVVTVKRLPSHESLIEHKARPNSEDDGKSSETEAPEEHQNAPILEHQAPEPNLHHQAAETETLHVTETQEEHETMPSTEDKEINASIEGRSQETEPNTKDEEIRACTDEVSSETEAAQDIGSPDQYEIKPDREDNEVPAIIEEASLETEAPQVSYSRPDDEKVSNTEEEELQATNDGVSSETETSEASKEESKLKGRIAEVKILCDESEMNDESDELEPTTTENELDENREDEGTEQQLENSSLMESFQTSSCQNSVEEWILVHQLDMTEEISRQIKHALMLNSLSPLRRTTACCTIM